MEEIALDPDPHLLHVMLSNFYKGFPPAAFITIAILIVMLIVSGLISGSETAFFSLQPADLNKLKKNHGKRGKKVISLRNKPKELLATILISNNFINVGIVIISTYLTTLMFNLKSHPALTFLIQIVIVTSLLLIFGEILPKIYANKKPVVTIVVFFEMLRPVFSALSLMIKLPKPLK